MSGTPRVVLDTNVLVSGFGYPSSVPGKVLALALDGRVRLILSRTILHEFLRVLPRMKHVQLTTNDISAIVRRLVAVSEIVEPLAAAGSELRDAADRPILGTLRASNADCPITGDKDLLVLAHRYPIATPAAFWANWRGDISSTGGLR